MIIDPVVLALTAIWAVAFAAGAGWFASKRDRSIPMWIAFGAILGPVALFLLWTAPPGRCSHCLAPVRGWLTTCDWCGMDIRPARDLAGPAASETGRVRTRHPPMASPALATPIITVAPVSHPTDEPHGRIIITASQVAGPAPEVRTESAPVPSAAEESVPPAVSSANGIGAVKDLNGTAGSKKTSKRAIASKKAPSRTRTKPVATARAAPVEMQTLASAVFVTGTVGLNPGSRYTVRHGGDQLQVLGPIDTSPSKVAFERQIAGTDATAPEGRLILSAAGNRGGTVLVFMGVDGDPAAVAAAINRAAIVGAPS